MELFRDINIDWLGKKWYFLGFSLIFSVAGILSMLAWHGVPLGVDFKGGTLVYVKFTDTPHEDTVRAATDRAGLKDARIQRYGDPKNNEILIGLEQRAANDGLCALGLRFSEDPLSPGARFKTLKERLGDAFEVIEIDSKKGNEHGFGKMAHSVLTLEVREVDLHPAYEARKRVVQFLKERLV